MDCCFYLSGTSIVSHLTVGRGILLTSHRFNFLDTLAPLLLGFVEFMLFGILQRWEGHPEWFYYWDLLFATHAFVAALLVTNRLWSTRVEEEFALPLRPLAIEYISWLRGDRKAALWIGAFSLLFWVLFVPCGFSMRESDCLHIVLGFLASSSLVPVILKAEKERKRIVEFLASVSPKEDAA
jgi:hypothetical protein